MAVEKMQFSMPVATGFEGFTFTPFQAQQEAFTVKARAEQEAFTVKARAEQEAFIVKARAEQEVKKGKPEVKAKVKKGKPEVQAKPEVKAKVEKAKPEVKVEVETITTEEALIKFIAELEKEEAFLKAKAEAEKQAGCGSKRKPALERDEEGAAFVARMEAMRPLYGDGDVSAGYDSQDDDPDTTFDDVMAQMQRQMEANNARWPFLVGA